MARLEEGSVSRVETGLKKAFQENGRDCTREGSVRAGGRLRRKGPQRGINEGQGLRHGKADFPKVTRPQGAPGGCQVASMRSGFLIQGHGMLGNSFGSWQWVWE